MLAYLFNKKKKTKTEKWTVSNYIKGQNKNFHRLLLAETNHEKVHKRQCLDMRETIEKEQITFCFF